MKAFVVLALAILLVAAVPDAQAQTPQTITRTAYGNITYETFDATTSTSVWNKALTTVNGELNFSGQQNISTSASYGKTTVIELRAKYTGGEEPRFGFITISNLDDTHAMFKGAGSNIQAFVKGSGGSTFTGPTASAGSSYATYKIYRGTDKTLFWRGGSAAGDTSITYGTSQPLVLISAASANPLFIDWVAVSKDNFVTVKGLTAGQRAEIAPRTTGGSTVSSTVVSGSTEAKVDLGGALTSTYGYVNGTVKVYSSTGSLASQQDFDLIFGGDEFAVAGVGAYSIEIKKNFNLIASPIKEGIPLSTIEARLAECGSSLQNIGDSKVWEWNAQGTPGWTHPSTITAGKGVWISASADCTLTISGTPYDGDGTLYKDFNLISANGDINRIDNTCGGKLTSIGTGRLAFKTWAWDAAAQRWTHPTNLDPRQGVWVSVSADSCVLDNDCIIEDGTSCPSGKSACSDMIAPTGKTWCS